MAVALGVKLAVSGDVSEPLGVFVGFSDVVGVYDALTPLNIEVVGVGDTEIVVVLVGEPPPTGGVPSNVAELDGVDETEVVGVPSALGVRLCDDDGIGEAVKVGETVDGGVGDTDDVALAAAPVLKVVVAVAETVGVRDDVIELVGVGVFENEVDAV